MSSKTRVIKICGKIPEGKTAALKPYMKERYGEKSLTLLSSEETINEGK